MTRTTGTRPTAAARAAGALRNGFRGRVITPPDADHDKARALWNGAIDKRPVLIARCADATDVAAAPPAALDTGLPMAVRGGGHGGAGTASVDDGLVGPDGQLHQVHAERDPELLWAPCAGRGATRRGHPLPLPLQPVGPIVPGQETPCLPTQH